MNTKYNFIITFLIIFSFNLSSQNTENKWVAGISLASAKYVTEHQAKIVGGEWAYQSPRFNVSRYLTKGLTIDAGFATAIGDKQKYTTFDGAIRYDFGTSMNNVVPYLLLGRSFISAKLLTPTVNLGAGNTFWISSKYGVNLQFMYKYSQDKFSSQFSHYYTSVGLVYSFGERSMVTRLWNSNH